MEIVASVRNRQDQHRTQVATNGRVSNVVIPVRYIGIWIEREWWRDALPRARDLLLQRSLPRGN